MCSHSQIIARIRALLIELQARDVAKQHVHCGCSRSALPQRESDPQVENAAQDHRAVCASIDGCDPTR